MELPESLQVAKMDASDSLPPVPAAKVETRRPVVQESPLVALPRALPTATVLQAPAKREIEMPEMHNEPAPTKPKAEERSESLNVQALELDAQQHAGKAIAEVFARTAAKALDAKSEDALRAKRLEDAARSLRGQSAELKQRAASETV